MSATNTSPPATGPDFTNDCCFNCGGERFTWARTVSFRATVDDGSVWNPPRDIGMPVWIRRCDACGNLQLFDPDYVRPGTDVK